MSKMDEVIGKTFGRLTILEFTHRGKWDYKYKVKCLCSCGKTTIVSWCNLTTGHTRSCGCLGAETMKKGRNYKHGMEGSREHYSWLDMKKRCYNAKSKSYKDYGGRGITVHESWLGSKGFSRFLEYMGTCPSGFSLDRINNEGNYEPGNCKWSSKIDQMNNTRKTRYVTLNGVKIPLAKAARVLGIDRGSLYYHVTNNQKIDFTSHNNAKVAI